MLRITLLVSLACGLLGCSKSTSAPLSAVLITIDTTNPEALDVYGTDRGISPRILQFAQESLVFESARTVAPLTLPAHASMLTGLYPLRHSVRDNGLWSLPTAANTLPERAKIAGYQTAAFVSAVVLSDVYGLSQGFDVYDEPEGSRGTMGESLLERDATAVTRAAQKWLLARDPDQPFFLWVHYFDPHAPYEPAPEFAQRAPDSPYLGEVAQVDHEVGNLLDTLAGEVGMENLVVALTSDHGESLGRHGEPTHSVYCYDATMRVPMILRLPHGARAGERSQAIASVVDVYPTLLELLELGPAGGIDGRSLMHPIPADRRVYMESYCGFLNYGWSGLAGLADAQGKYLHSSQPELFEYANDAQELQNLFSQKTSAAAPYIAALRDLSALPRLKAGEANQSASEASARMRAMGYAGSASAATPIPEPLEAGAWPAPAESADELAAFYNASIFASMGKKREAIDRLRPIVTQNPGNVYAIDMLAGLLVEARQFEEARGLLLPLLAAGFDRYTIRLQLGTCFENLGDKVKAREHFNAALGHMPGDELARLGLERIGD